MSKLFDEVEFVYKPMEAPKAPKPPPIPEFPSLDTFKPAIEKIRIEMIRVEEGTSELRSAMYFPKDNNPARNTLNLFEKDTNERTLIKFFELVKQDYGTRVHDTFVVWVREVYTDLKRRLANE